MTGSRDKIVYLVGEDWFFCSHFLPMGRAARAAGFEVVILTRPGERRDDLEREGFRVVTLDFARNDLNPLRKLATVARIASVLRDERPGVLHNIALGYALVGTLAARQAGVPVIVNAITGLGYLRVATSARMRAMRAALWKGLGPIFDTKRVQMLFENPDDRALAIGQRWTVAERSTLVPGAGVDTDHFAILADPRERPVRFALVGRLLWQKGPDIAVEALRLLRTRGVACELMLVGRSDPDNPRAVPEEQLQAWAAEPGITWRGFSSDVREVWADAHIALAPSRGGEGLPRTLIEAAACGRPLVVTDVAGSREIARPGRNGLHVAVDDAKALADALQTLIEDDALRQAMGAESRAIAVAEYREDIVGDIVVALYRRALGESRRQRTTSDSG